MPTLGEPVLITPLDGRRLRKEDGELLSADGETVIFTSYWARRFQDGDVALAQTLSADAEPAPVAEPAPRKPRKE